MFYCRVPTNLMRPILKLMLILFLLVTTELRLIYTMDLNKFIVWKYLLLYLKQYSYGKFATVVPLL